LPPDLPPLLRNFLDCCLDRLEQQRWTAQQLRQHPLLSTKPLQPVVGDVAAVATLDAAAAVADANAAAAAAAAPPPRPLRQNWLPRRHRRPRAATLGGRLRNDFEIVSFLGKGGYGDVVKARNRLDGRLYAVKRVRLKNQRSDVIKKILREVRLLSRLNHEHVVRYYYSWLEDEMVEDSSTTSASNPTVTETSNRLEAVNASDSPSFVSPTKQQRTRMRKQEQQKQNNSGSLEDLVGAMSRAAGQFVCVRGIRAWLYRSAGQTAGSSAAVDKADKVSAAGATGEAEASQHRLTSLYIQMEFCERSTLRLAIDNGLPRDERRAWRFFKELLEGLEHIHRCDIIHRDLKPSNVFIDSTDHIKIGDFGLATPPLWMPALRMPPPRPRPAALSADAGGGGSMTGQIGTFFYLAPELLLANKVSAYSAKVDMYSLGVIFFEMTRPDIGTEMERRLLLTDLRLPEVRLPDDYGAAAGADQPGSSGDRLRKMLESSQLPAYIFETTQFENLVKSAVAMPESRNYKFLLNCLFSRKVTLPEDHAFDVDMCRPTPVELLSARRWTRDAFERVFARHGAVCQQTPLVMPRLDAFEDLLRPLTVYYLGKDGDVLGLPCDLRVPYARFAARAGVQSARRYAIDRVVRERTMDTHPREMTDCAFDIVCHANAAEVCERLQLPPASAGAASVAGSVVAELAERLSGLELDGQSVHRLAGLLAEETDAATLLQGGYYRRVFSGANRDAAALIKRGLSAIDQTRLLYEKFGFARPLAIRARPLFVGGVGGYATGANWRLDVLASGGRYDDLLRRFARPAAAAASAPPPGSGAVGVSFAFDRLAQIIRRRPSPPPRPSAGWSSPLDRPAVLVAPLGPLGMRESACRLLHRLWLRQLCRPLATPASEELLDGTDELRRLFREHRAACVVLARRNPPMAPQPAPRPAGPQLLSSASDRRSAVWTTSSGTSAMGVAGRPASGGVETHSSLSLKAGSSEPGGGAAAMATGVSAASAASGSTSVTAGILGDDPGATDAAAGGLLADPAGQQISNEDFEASISVTLLLGDRYQHHQRRKAESQARARLAAIAAASAAAAASGGLQLRAAGWKEALGEHRRVKPPGQRKLLDRLRRWLTDFERNAVKASPWSSCVGIGDDSGGGQRPLPAFGVPADLNR
uniref:Protein kinase domain-containing protein n=1 Tax=Macrostomum lignano TaxID=282301 RepID=A0A1I8GVC3_9PLAT